EQLARIEGVERLAGVQRDHRNSPEATRRFGIAEDLLDVVIEPAGSLLTLVGPVMAIRRCLREQRKQQENCAEIAEPIHKTTARILALPGPAAVGFPAALLDGYNRLMRPVYRWQLRSRALELGRRTLIMGVVNVTPDSFSDGGQFLEPERAVEHGLRLLDEGADILDIGGESTRPGAHVAAEAGVSVTQDEELRRVLPVVQGVMRARPEA